MWSFAVFVIVAFLTLRLIYGNENDRIGQKPLYIGIACFLVYYSIHNAILLTGTEKQAIIGGSGFGLVVLVATTGFYYWQYKHNSSTRPDVGEGPSTPENIQEEGPDSYMPEQSERIAKTINPTRSQQGYILIAPIIILILLVASWFFRWDPVGYQKFDGGGAAYWEKDRWTGAMWVELYAPSQPYTRGTMHKNKKISDIATGVWGSLFILNGIWLFRSYRRQSAL